MHMSPQDALVYVMVISSAADASITDRELARIGALVERLPIFEGYEASRLPEVATACVDLMKSSSDLDEVLDVVLAALPERLEDTAYALAVELVAVDLDLGQEELRWLEILRDRLRTDRLVTAAIERAARARYRRA